jgi:hypothetical protein
MSQVPAFMSMSQILPASGLEYAMPTRRVLSFSSSELHSAPVILDLPNGNGMSGVENEKSVIIHTLDGSAEEVENPGALHKSGQKPRLETGREKLVVVVEYDTDSDDQFDMGDCGGVLLHETSSQPKKKEKSVAGGGGGGGGGVENENENMAVEDERIGIVEGDEPGFILVSTPNSSHPDEGIAMLSEETKKENKQAHFGSPISNYSRPSAPISVSISFLPLPPSKDKEPFPEFGM